MAEEARRHRVGAIAAVGTAGLRAAANSTDFVAAVEARCGVLIDVISGEEEAHLAYRRRDRGPAHAGLARRVRHRRRQLPVQLRRGRPGRGALQRGGRGGAVHRGVRPGRRDIPAPARRGPCRDRRGPRAARRPPHSRCAARHGRSGHEPGCGPARPGGVRPRRRPRHGARPGRDRPPDRDLPDPRRRRAAVRSWGSSPRGPRSSWPVPPSSGPCSTSSGSTRSRSATGASGTAYSPSGSAWTSMT